jgi:DNA polymerase-3 subunit alpha
MCKDCGPDLKMSHCHVHTDASRIDGLGTVGRLAKAASDRGFQHLAMTDHGTLSNAISFTAAMNAVGVKPVMGLEAYVELSGKTFHLTLLGDGNRGLNSLIELNNAGARSENQRPAFSLDLLKKHSDGVTVLTGCPASPMQVLPYPDAREIALRLKGIFQDRFFAEAMFVSDSHPWDRAAQLAHDLKLRPILTNDVHFANAEDAASHTVLVRLKAAFSYDSRHLFLATPHELITRVRGMAPDFLEMARRGMRNSHKLLSRLASPVWDGVPTLPHVDSAADVVKSLCGASLATYLATHPHLDAPTYEARLQYEVGVIGEMDFMTYFYILRDIVSFARGAGVRVGPGRGSGAGSLMLFLLGITEVDPLEYGLQFERFLNPKRKEMPDVDVDFDSDGRGTVIKYAQERWKAMPVATYSRYTHKTLVADLCRFLRVPRDVSEAVGDQERGSEDFQRVARLHPVFAPTYDAMIDQIRHIGQHAGGVIITDIPVPLERTAHGDVVAAWTEGLNSRELSTAGVVKYDLLGISSLSVLRRLEDKHGFRAPRPVDDAPEYKLFRDGDVVGIFQFAGSDGIVSFTKKVAPRTFAELVAINALYRPGALDSGGVEHYLEWREKPRHLHPLIDAILAETYGVICYQEQFMAIFAAVTKGDLGDADFARKTIVKSKPGNPEWEAKFAELKARFFRGGLDQGIPEKTVKLVWDEIITHARYSFNKSHAVAYTILSWEMAWWKYHHPADFYAAMLSVDPASAQRYLFDVVGRGIEVVAPHVNRSSRDYESDGERVYLPLSAVKNLGDVGVNAILDARPFASVGDFMARVPKRGVPGRARLGLWELGAFHGLSGTRDELAIAAERPLSEREKQKEFLGYMLPSPRMMRAVRAATKQGLVGGVISEIEPRSSKFGEYLVVRLLPQGTCWTRNITTLAVGDMVKLKIKPNSGKIVQVLPLL